MEVFPNPASQTIHIKGIDMLLNKANYTLTDLNKKIIKQGKPDAETIELSDITKGIYKSSLKTNKGIINKKIVVE
ncbi:MAG: T9SS type A sorting domain-containing protein [Prolixibacteraceae bacterium]|nr:T9SS type A sorting domain-containing protein [Prolixibacteraceae bacterium]